MLDVPVKGPGSLLQSQGLARMKMPAGNDRKGIRVVITGKGGVGKTTLTALLAHHFAGEGFRVLAVDGDPQQNLAVTLGIPPERADAIVPVADDAGYVREKTGAGPGSPSGGLITLNPNVGDVLDRFAVPVSRNLRVLVMGGVRQAGSGCLCAAYTLLSAILRRFRLLPEDVILLDTPAGLEHFGRALADGFSTALVVAEPSYNALSVARQSAKLARDLAIGNVILVVNRVGRQDDEQSIRQTMGDTSAFSRIILLPDDPALSGFEPSVKDILLRESPLTGKLHDLEAIILEYRR